jgi:glycerol-3-phosphate dehydrogenase
MHGSRAPNIVRLAAFDERMLRPICPHSTHIVAEAVYALRRECAITLSDVLLRRVPVALGACWSAECSRTAAQRIGKPLGWNEEEMNWQLETLEIDRAAFLRKPEAVPAVRKSPTGTQRFA